MHDATFVGLSTQGKIEKTEACQNVLSRIYFVFLIKNLIVSVSLCLSL